MHILYWTMRWVWRTASVAGRGVVNPVSFFVRSVTLPSNGLPDHSDEPSASALFARRLMHYCCEEVDTAMAHPGLPDTRYVFDHSLFSLFPNGIWLIHMLCSISTAFSGDSETMREQLEDQLEDLADGLDVLMILERAFEKTIQAHVVPSGHTGYTGTASPTTRTPTERGTTPPRQSSSQTCTPLDSDNASLPPHSGSDSHENHAHTAHTAHPFGADAPATAPQPSSVPLMEGSSTALLAILEHPTQPSPKSAKPSSLFSPHPRHSQSPATDRGAVIRIAHLGDCMAMLIRGEEIVWRTEEMWWNVCIFLLSSINQTIDCLVVQYAGPIRACLCHKTTGCTGFHPSSHRG